MRKVDKSFGVEISYDLNTRKFVIPFENRSFAEDFSRGFTQSLKTLSEVEGYFAEEFGRENNVFHQRGALFVNNFMRYIKTHGFEHKRTFSIVVDL